MNPCDAPWYSTGSANLEEGDAEEWRRLHWPDLSQGPGTSLTNTSTGTVPGPPWTQQGQQGNLTAPHPSTGSYGDFSGYTNAGPQGYLTAPHPSTGSYGDFSGFINTGPQYSYQPQQPSTQYLPSSYGVTQPQQPSNQFQQPSAPSPRYLPPSDQSPAIQNPEPTPSQDASLDLSFLNVQNSRTLLGYLEENSAWKTAHNKRQLLIDALSTPEGRESILSTRVISRYCTSKELGRLSFCGDCWVETGLGKPYLCPTHRPSRCPKRQAK